MQVHEIMTLDVVTIDGNANLRLIDDIMAELGIRHIPVLEDGRLVGLISERDLFKARLSSAVENDEMGQRAFLNTLRVQEVMTHPVLTISPQASVADAADFMLTKLIGCLPVVQGTQLVGIITKTDLLHRLSVLDVTTREAPALTDGQVKKQTGQLLPNVLPN